MSKVLVTGATGFLGHHLVHTLLANGYEVRALARETSDTSHLRHNVEVVFGDVRDQNSLLKAAEGCRFVIHAAGLFRFWGDKRDFERTNVEGTAYILEAASRNNVERFVHISSVAVVGEPPAGPIDETTPCKPADPYQHSKLLSENFVKMYSASTRLATVILRPGACYGPWGRYAFNRLFFEDPLKGRLIEVHRGQHAIFPVFAPDVARAAVTALEAGRVGQIYNIAGDTLTQREANTIISRLAGLPTWRFNVPDQWMLKLAGWMAQRAEKTGKEPYYPLTLANYVFRDWHVSNAKAQAELGFRPTPFKVGARQTLEWYWEQKIFRRPPGAPHPLPAPAQG